MQHMHESIDARMYTCPHVQYIEVHTRMRYNEQFNYALNYALGTCSMEMSTSQMEVLFAWKPFPWAGSSCELVIN